MVAGLMRLNAIRELMRLEMPDRYSDLMTTASGAQNVFSLPYSVLQMPMLTPSITLTYQQRVNANPLGKPTAEFEDAECLYMILTSGLADESIGNQHTDPRTVGDADGDGMPEFHDSWGRPIRFIRCAPSFVSDLQIVDSIARHDPFDPLKIDKLAYVTTPLIYSHGLDHQDGITHPPADGAGFALPSTSNPTTLAPGMVLSYGIYSPTPAVAGAPVDPTTGDDQDNISNHLIGQ
jgi:hypothetical protein